MNRSLKDLRNSRKYQVILGLVLAAILLPLIYLFGRGYVIKAWDRAISYNVNPLIFVALLLITTPAYYWSWYRILRKGLQRQWVGFAEAVLINRLIWAPPWVYVYIFGEGYPWWVRPAILLWGSVSVVALIVKAIISIRSKKKEKVDESLGDPGLAVRHDVPHQAPR